MYLIFGKKKECLIGIEQASSFYSTYGYAKN